MEDQLTWCWFGRVLHHSLVSTIEAFVFMYLLKYTIGKIKLVYRNWTKDSVAAEKGILGRKYIV